jgi:auxin efflux carrier family protein
MHLRRRRMVVNATVSLRRLLRLSRHPNTRETGDVEVGSDFENKDTVTGNETAGHDEGFDRKTLTGIVTTSTPTSDPKDSFSLTSRPISLTTELSQQPTNLHTSHCHPSHHDLPSRARRFLKQLLKPCTVAIILSFVVALVDPFKALFIPPSSNFQPRFRPVAPDGQPPLAFIFDTATFIGAACIPLGLICLGSALGCLSLRSGGPFPKGAIVSLALGKMIIIPIIGIAITRWFVRLGFVHRDDKVLQFVCMYVVSSFSCH